MGQLPKEASTLVWRVDASITTQKWKSMETCTCDTVTVMRLTKCGKTEHTSDLKMDERLHSVLLYTKRKGKTWRCYVLLIMQWFYRCSPVQVKFGCA